MKGHYFSFPACRKWATGRQPSLRTALVRIASTVLFICLIGRVNKNFADFERSEILFFPECSQYHKEDSYLGVYNFGVFVLVQTFDCRMCRLWISLVWSLPNWYAVITDVTINQKNGGYYLQQDDNAEERLSRLALMFHSPFKRFSSQSWQEFWDDRSVSIKKAFLKKEIKRHNHIETFSLLLLSNYYSHYRTLYLSY